MKTDGETSSAIRRDGSVADGRRGAASKYFTEAYLAGVLAIGENFLTLFISRRGAKIHSVVIIYYHCAAAAARERRASLSNREGGEQ